MPRGRGGGGRGRGAQASTSSGSRGGRAKAKVAAKPEDLCLYLVEPDESGIVPDDWILLVRQCLTDKLFADNHDHVAICRSDVTSSVVFSPVTWDVLRSGEKKLRQKGKKNNDCLEALTEMCDYLEGQDSEDAYENKKILFFGSLKAQDIKKDKAVRLGNCLKNAKINLSMIVPNEEEMNSEQKNNYEVLSNALLCQPYEEFVYICSKQQALKQIFNTFSKPTKRSMPWNVVLEIGSDIQINIGGFVCTRKNTQSELKTALVKDEKPQVGASQSQSMAMQPYGNQDAENDGNGAEGRTVVVELARNLVDKEIAWKEKTGAVVPEENLGKAYFYGDKLIPFNELEAEDLYSSGEKCLKLLVFCPRSNILPAYQQGDGTTLFFAKKGDTPSEMKLDALIHALHNTESIAIVRKVYRKNTRVNLGFLSPDLDRNCLVFGELCFADDVSIPHFPALFRQDHTSEDDGTMMTAKEHAVDDYILKNTIDGFHPFEGPVDPAAVAMRMTITSRMLEAPAGEKPVLPARGNIELFFEKSIGDTVMKAVKDAFPLKETSETAERPAGANIFRKRVLDADDKTEPEETKKIKEELSSQPTEAEQASKSTEKEEDVDYDDLLDQMD